MHYVGIDLAWGERSPTGLAVLDAQGRLVVLARVQTDDDIAAALAAYDGPLVAAVDAPLVVTNASGKRGAERALDRDFARFQAGTHSSNTAKPWFVPEPRGARLARRLGLEIHDPRAPRRAFEAHPHAATVALFGLERTLKYKAKPGRTLESQRAELLRLTTLLGTLRDADPPLLLGDAWRDHVATVAAAARKSELRRAEDPVDAVVCAYVAAYADRRPADVTTYADETGAAIVTPTLPSTPEP